MPLATLRSLTFVGIRHIPVNIEVHISSGLPCFTIVGLADTEVRESKERVRSALINSGFEFPSQRITVNLAPADLPKGSASFDLAIALGIASASGQLPGTDLSRWIFAGELSLSGELVNARSPFALAVASRKLAALESRNLQLMLPRRQAEQVWDVPDISIFGATTLYEVAAHLVGHGEPMSPVSRATDSSGVTGTDSGADLSEVIGHEVAKHAMLVAASGQHHLRLVGPPGSGKSMLAQRMENIMPPMEFDDALDMAAIRSLKNEPASLTMQRPFRNPHSGTSMAALIGGGNPPCPGEITLANKGVLFTDEVLEFDRRSLESLREPLETGRVNISRAGHQASFPARFLWVCAHNPCPCGWLGHPVKPCRCTPEQIRRYQGKLSGPLKDRLDISLEVNPIDPARLVERPAKQMSSEEMKSKVQSCRQVQLERQGCLNGEMSAGQIQTHCQTSTDAEKLLLAWAYKNHQSSRALHRICRVARTLADLETSEKIEKPHIATAIQYRKSLNSLEI